jgi:hypothetical protein
LLILSNALSAGHAATRRYAVGGAGRVAQQTTDYNYDNWIIGLMMT